MSGIKAANFGLRFLLELYALAALGYWGFQTGRGTLAKVGLGIGAPLLAAVVWGTFVAPNAPVDVPAAIRLVFELLVFGAAVAALYAANQPRLALALGIVYVINRVLVTVWGQ